MMVQCGRGCRWKQAGNQTGHCALCHRNYDSLEAFDRHQSIKKGRTVCVDPNRSRWFESSERDGIVYYRRAR